MNRKTAWERFKRYLGVEIGIEYKACLYFYCILFFYCCYQLWQRSSTASILHMAEMIATTYVMGYVQVYLFGNFDEAEHVGRREIAGGLVCTATYTALSFLFGWFDKKIGMTIGFALFWLFAYLCAFIINKIKRDGDTRQLNNMLSAYKEKEADSSMHAEGGKTDEECN